MWTDLWEAWKSLGAAGQGPLLMLLSNRIVWLARRAGLDCRPGLESVVLAVLVGASAGAVTSGWQGAVLGALAGFAGTGLWEAEKGVARYGEQRLVADCDAAEDADEQQNA